MKLQVDCEAQLIELLDGQPLQLADIALPPRIAGDHAEQLGQVTWYLINGALKRLQVVAPPCEQESSLTCFGVDDGCSDGGEERLGTSGAGDGKTARMDCCQ